MQVDCSGLKSTGLSAHTQRHALDWCWNAVLTKSIAESCSGRGEPTRVHASHRWFVIMSKHWRESETILLYFGPCLSPACLERWSCFIPNSLIMIIFNKHLCLSHRVVAIADLSSRRLYEISSNVTFQHMSLKEPKWTGLGVFLWNTIYKNGFCPYFFTMAAHWLLNNSHMLWLWDGLNKEHCVTFSSHSSRNKSDWMQKRQYKQKYKVAVNKTEALKHMQILA